MSPTTQNNKRLQKAFENVKKCASLASEAQEEFSHALQDSKYSEIELPDDVIDTTDYGNGSMSFEKFIQRMDELLKLGKTTQEEVNAL